MNERDQLLRKFRKSKSVYDKRLYQDKRNRVNIMLRKSKSSYSKELLRESSNDPDKFWRTLKSLYPGKSKINTRYQSFDIARW